MRSYFFPFLLTASFYMYVQPCILQTNPSLQSNTSLMLFQFSTIQINVEIWCRAESCDKSMASSVNVNVKEPAKQFDG